MSDPDERMVATVRLARALTHALANRLQVIEGTCHIARSELPLDGQPLLQPLSNAAAELTRLVELLRHEVQGVPAEPSGARLLLIDPQAPRRDALACLLEGLGHEVRPVADAAMAARVDGDFALVLVGRDVDDAVQPLLDERGWSVLNLAELTSDESRQMPLVALAAALDARLQ